MATRPKINKPAESAVVETTEVVTQSDYDQLLGLAIARNPSFSPPHTKETSQAFFKRLALELAEVTDEEFNGLQESAQLWYNGAADALNSSTDLPVLDGYADRASTVPGPATTKPATTGDAEFVDADGKPLTGLKLVNAKRAAAKAAAAAGGAPATTTAKAAATPKEPKAPAEPRAPGITSQVRVILVQNLGADLDVLRTKCTEAGLTVKDSTLSTLRSDVAATMLAAKTAGLLK